jgi:hypothetical protein
MLLHAPFSPVNVGIMLRHAAACAFLACERRHPVGGSAQTHAAANVRLLSDEA